MKNKSWKMKLRAYKRIVSSISGFRQRLPVERNPTPKIIIYPRLKPWSSGAVIILAASVIIAGFLSLFASASPDGLEKVAEEFGFLEKGNNLISGFMPDYVFPEIKNTEIATSIAGIIGTLFVFSVLFLTGKVLHGINN